MFWGVVGTLWVIALAALVAVFLLPESLDLYFHDTYVVVAQSHLILVIVLFLILPLTVVTILHLRAAA
jgi:hypothetical protein